MVESAPRHQVVLRPDVWALIVIDAVLTLRANPRFAQGTEPLYQA